MAHTVCTTNGSDTMDYVRQLGEVVFDSEMESEEKIRRLFEIETEEFGLEHAFFSRIDTDAGTQRFDIVHGSRGDLTPNNVVPLSETYCRKAIADPSKTLAVSDALEEGWGSDPAYERFHLGSYLGKTVTVDNELYGMLCYANTEPRSEPLTDEEVSLIEIEAQWLGYLLSQPPFTPSDGVSERSTDLSGPSPTRFDSMMNALMKPERRVVLFRLLDQPTDVDVESITRELSGEDAELKLYHNDLPKLVGEGYVEWDTDSETVSRGPDYAYLEPVLRMLVRYPETDFR